MTRCVCRRSPVTGECGFVRSKSCGGRGRYEYRSSEHTRLSQTNPRLKSSALRGWLLITRDVRRALPPPAGQFPERGWFLFGEAARRSARRQKTSMPHCRRLRILDRAG